MNRFSTSCVIFSALLLAIGFSSVLASESPLEVGDPLPPLRLEDQHGESRELSAMTKALLFSRSMKGGDLLKGALDGLPRGFLQQRGIVYISDVSGMPSLVLRFMALPKLRKRSYPILLDRDGSPTSGIPTRPDQATLLSLDALRVRGVEFFTDADALRSRLLEASDSTGEDSPQPKASP